MALLFEINDKKVYPKPEVLLLSPFKEIWDRDTSEGKHTALQEFAYIEFMASAKKSNPFRGYSDEVRSDKIIAQVFTEDNLHWVPDSLVEEGIEHWQEYQQGASTTYQYWRAAVQGAEKMAKYFVNVNLDERTERGALVFKSTDLINNLTKTKAVLANLKGLEKDVEQELFEESRTKADKRISPFARKDSFK